MKNWLLILISVVLLLAGDCLAEADLSLKVSDITFSKAEPLEGETVRVFARVFNIGDADVYGFVLFFNNGVEMADPQPISVKVGTYDDVFFDWQAVPGTYNVQAKIAGTWPNDSNPENDIAVKEDYFVDLDTDGDKIGNTKDPDDDNDGLSDEREAFLGTDPLNPDSDGDGVGDYEDAFPLDKTEAKDSDRDGIGDNSDLDDDNDTLSDEEEKKMGTDPLSPDTDGDEVEDSQDAFPLDETEWQDSDSDGLGNNIDVDDDNDGFSDEEELFVLDSDPFDPFSPRKTQASIAETAVDSVRVLAGVGLALVIALFFLFRRKKPQSGA